MVLPDEQPLRRLRCDQPEELAQNTQAELLGLDAARKPPCLGACAIWRPGR